MTNTYTKNQYGLKESEQCFRNIKIKGVSVRFESWCIDYSEMQDEKEEAKKLGLRTRMVNGELFREVRK